MRRRRDLVQEWARQAVDGDNPAVPAATVVLVRDASEGVETLMVHKDSKVAFGGMWVFPGGRIDDDDRRDAADDIDAAQRAAARESQEEAGIALDPGSFEWISFWLPPPQTPRRFATWFFVAPAPHDHEVTIDDGEIKDHRWLRPSEALRLRELGEIEIVPPTFVTLEWLTRHEHVTAVMDAARSMQPERYETRLAAVDGGAVALWAGDAGYEDRDPDAPGPRHRLWMMEDGWRYDREL